MPRRASTYHDTEKANSGELDNSGGSAAAPNTSREGRFDPCAADCSMAYRSTGKNRPLPLKPTLPRVLSRANASVVDEE